MAEDFEKSTTSDIRTSAREELVALRKDKNYSLLKQKRLDLSNVENSVKDLTLEEFKSLAQSIKCKNPPLEVLKKLKNHCCFPEYIDAFMRVEGAFDSLIRTLIGKNGQKQLEAAACLGNLACGSQKAAQRVAKQAGAYLVSFISGGSHFLQSQCAWSAGNVAGHCKSCYAILKSQGILPALLSTITSSSTEVVESVVYAMYFCTSYEEIECVEVVKSDIIHNLLHILHDSKLSDVALSYAGLSLANILYTIANENMTEAINKCDVNLILSCVEKNILNEDINPMIIIPLIRCMGYITVSNLMCEHLSNHPTFQTFLNQVLKGKSHYLKKEIIWVLTNIAVYSDDPLMQLEKEPILKTIQLLLNPLDKAVIQVLYYMCILVSKSKEICDHLLQQGTVNYITSFLECGNDDIIKASNVFLEICNGVQ